MKEFRNLFVLAATVRMSWRGAVRHKDIRCGRPHSCTYSF